MSSELIKIFPVKLREKIGRNDLLAEGYTEIRFRCNGPVILLRGKEELFLHKNGGISTMEEDAYHISVNEIREMMEYISNFSAYAYEDELRHGFLTIQGGHRVGICGRVVLSEGKIKTIRNISFINLRLAREKRGCGERLLPYLFEEKHLCHTLIVSPPGYGKTTLLRDMIRLISNGNEKFAGKKVGVVDERSELAACYHGVPQNDLGKRTDVMDGCPKILGIELLLRSMSPEVLAVDELGGEADVDVIHKSIACGCTILATVHGEKKDGRFQKGNRLGFFERYVFLKPGGSPGVVDCILDSCGREVSLE